MTGTIARVRRKDLASKWLPVTPGVIPVTWLDLIADGRILLTQEGIPRDQKQPILSLTVGEWSLRKAPGVGAMLTLKNAAGLAYGFKFDSKQRIWLYTARMSRPRERTREEERPSDASAEAPQQGIKPPSFHSTSSDDTGCLIATLLFDPKKRSEFTVGGLDGVTFFADGTFSYGDQVFGRTQGIEYSDWPDCPDRSKTSGLDAPVTTIQRNPGRGKMLTICDCWRGRTYRFSYRSTCAHPTGRRWYRWSTCKRPRLRDRFLAARQRWESDSFLLRAGVNTTIRLCAIVAAIVLVTCPLLWPIGIYFAHDSE